MFQLKSSNIRAKFRSARHQIKWICFFFVLLLWFSFFSSNSCCSISFTRFGRAKFTFKVFVQVVVIFSSFLVINTIVTASCIRTAHAHACCLMSHLFGQLKFRLKMNIIFKCYFLSFLLDALFPCVSVSFLFLSLSLSVQQKIIKCGWYFVCVRRKVDIFLNVRNKNNLKMSVTLFCKSRYSNFLPNSKQRQIAEYLHWNSKKKTLKHAITNSKSPNWMQWQPKSYW